MKKSPNFPAICHFASLLHSTNMDLWIVSLAQIGPQAYKKVPQGQIRKKENLGLGILFDDAGPLCNGVNGKTSRLVAQ